MEDSCLTIENIVLNAHPADRFEAIQMAGDILVKNGYATPEYIDDMFEREKTVSVYIGNNVAIPHGLVTSGDKIIKSGISVVQTPKGVHFETGDAYVFIGIAGKNDEHIQILSHIAMVCCDMENVYKIRDAKTKEEILNILL